MAYEAGKRFFSQDLEQTIFDRKGLQYKLKIDYDYRNDESPSININLIRMQRECVVGISYCRILTAEDMLLADIEIKQVDFLSINDKFFKLFHPNEPSDYRFRGLGTAILRKVIDLAKQKRIKRLYGSLTQEDIGENKNLIRWYRKHGFKIETPTSQEISNAAHRICLYLS